MSLALVFGLLAAQSGCALDPHGGVGFVSLDTDPPSRLYYGDKLIGETPVAKAELPVGCVELKAETLTKTSTKAVRIKVERNKHLRYKLGVETPPPEGQPCKLAPSGGHGFLNLDVKPAAQIYYDGKWLADSPASKVKVPAGCVELELRELDGSRAKKVRVQVIENRRTRYQFDLNR